MRAKTAAIDSIVNFIFKVGCGSDFFREAYCGAGGFATVRGLDIGERRREWRKDSRAERDAGTKGRPKGAQGNRTEVRAERKEGSKSED